MAKRTPDYTKQVRHEKPRRQPVAAPGKKAARRGEVPPPQKGAASAVYVSLVGGTAVYLYAAYLATGSATTKSIIFSLVIALCGILTNVLTGVLATYSLYPRRFAMPGVDKRLLVVESGLKGGALITAGQALEHNRTVYADASLRSVLEIDRVGRRSHCVGDR